MQKLLKESEGNWPLQ